MPLRFKVQTKEIDCAPYGIEGKIVVCGITGSIQYGLNGLYYKLNNNQPVTEHNALEVGHANIKEVTVYLAKECVISFPGQSTPDERLTDADINTFPAKLLDEIGSAIEDLSNFPLTSAHGMAQKPEESRPSKTASSKVPATQTSKRSK